MSFPPPHYLEALAAATGVPATAAAIERLGKEYGPDAAAFAFTQACLRKRAGDKFPGSKQMLFEREALEQATHHEVAAYHRARFEEASMHLKGAPVLLDATCGIGGDLISFASVLPCVGCDVDATRLQIAQFNLNILGLHAELVHGDSRELLARRKFPFVWLDPARRSAGMRVSDSKHYAPDPRTVLPLLKEISLGGIKLSPLLPDRALDDMGPSVEFISHHGECKEALVWLGELSGVGRRAVLAHTGQVLETRPLQETVTEANLWLMEADPAAIRAHALGNFGLPGLGTSNGYLTGSNPISSPWLRNFRVLYDGPGQVGRTRQALQELDGATPDIKVRAAKVDGVALRKALAGSGNRPCLVAVYAVGLKIRHAILAHPDT